MTGLQDDDIDQSVMRRERRRLAGATGGAAVLAAIIAAGVTAAAFAWRTGSEGSMLTAGALLDWVMSLKVVDDTFGTALNVAILAMTLVLATTLANRAKPDNITGAAVQHFGDLLTTIVSVSCTATLLILALVAFPKGGDVALCLGLAAFTSGLTALTRTTVFGLRMLLQSDLELIGRFEALHAHAGAGGDPRDTRPVQAAAAGWRLIWWSLGWLVPVTVALWASGFALGGADWWQVAILIVVGLLWTPGVVSLVVGFRVCRAEAKGLVPFVLGAAAIIFGMGVMLVAAMWSERWWAGVLLMTALIGWPLGMLTVAHLRVRTYAILISRAVAVNLTRADKRVNNMREQIANGTPIPGEPVPVPVHVVSHSPRSDAERIGLLVIAATAVAALAVNHASYRGRR